MILDGSKIAKHIRQAPEMKRRIIKAKSQNEMQKRIKEFVVSANESRDAYYRSLATMKRWAANTSAEMLEAVDKIQTSANADKIIKVSNRLVEGDYLGLTQKMGFPKDMVKKALQKTNEKIRPSIHKNYPARQILYDSMCLPVKCSLASNDLNPDEFALIMGASFWDDAWDFVVDYVAPVVAVVAAVATVAFAGIAVAAFLGADALLATTASLAATGEVIDLIGAIGAATGASFLTGVAIAATINAAGGAILTTGAILVANADKSSANLIGTGEVAQNVAMNISSGASSSITFCGNKKTKELHIPQCGYGQSITPNRRVYWNSISKAVTAGYNGCFYCLKAYDRG
jgi:hypothetical protein